MIAAFVIIVGLFILSFYPDITDGWFGESTTTQKEPVNEPPKNEPVKEQTKQNDLNNEDEDLNPFKRKVSQENMTDGHFRDYIHNMSHQKVIADSKWGFYEITDERINWLLEAIDHENVSDNLNNKQEYRDILTRWESDDFSRVDKDHNIIWSLQGGSIGVATGILSPEAEALYVKNTKEHTR